MLHHSLQFSFDRSNRCTEPVLSDLFQTAPVTMSTLSRHKMLALYLYLCPVSDPARSPWRLGRRHSQWKSEAVGHRYCYLLYSSLLYLLCPGDEFTLLQQTAAGGGTVSGGRAGGARHRPRGQPGQQALTTGELLAGVAMSRAPPSISQSILSTPINAATLELDLESGIFLIFSPIFQSGDTDQTSP